MKYHEWRNTYSRRITTAERAISLIQSFHKVFLAPFCNEPQTLVEELIQQKSRLKNVFLYNIVLGSPCLYGNIDCNSHFKIRTFLSSASLRNAFVHGDAEYLPVNLSEIPRLLGQEKMDVALIQVTPPNEKGFCNLGLSVDVVQTLIKSSTIVIAEVNSQLPYTYGNTFVHVSDIDLFVPTNRPLLTIHSRIPNDDERIIGELVSELVPDYATIQVGVGKLSDSILYSLKEKKGLGIHTGLITDPIVDLMELEVITNEEKEINHYKTVGTTLTGTEKLYQYAHRNALIELHSTDYTHNAAVISKISNFHAINSALEVDLFGQVNAELIGNYPIGGVGGQMDFIHGARLSKGGKSIIALPSTAKDGAYSRIKVTNPYVTSIKSDIDYVVTEFGIASLFGKSLKERARELIAIAHPDYRDQLLKDFNSL